VRSGTYSLFRAAKVTIHSLTQRALSVTPPALAPPPVVVITLSRTISPHAHLRVQAGQVVDTAAFAPQPKPEDALPPVAT
jgi:hypothetical protein